jgi:dTDP-4-amino-4,6-dideoxy-D-galactose acyltransferase
MKIEALNWDSDFFGYKIGKAEIENFHIEQYEEALAFFKRSGIKLIYAYPLDQLSKNSLIELKIPLVDIKVTFEKNDNFSLKNILNTKSYDTNDQYEALEKLALLSGKYSRFRIDNHFSNNEFFRLYTEWIKKSISKEIATDVIVYKDSNLLKGFVSYKITPTNDIVIGLIAVDILEHNKGIGKILMQSIENIAFQKNSKKITVYTQLQNKTAITFYHSCGYQIKKQQEIFHLWIR